MVQVIRTQPGSSTAVDYDPYKPFAGNATRQEVLIPGAPYVNPFDGEEVTPLKPRGKKINPFTDDSATTSEDSTTISAEEDIYDRLRDDFEVEEETAEGVSAAAPKTEAETEESLRAIEEASSVAFANNDTEIKSRFVGIRQGISASIEALNKAGFAAETEESKEDLPVLLSEYAILTKDLESLPRDTKTLGPDGDKALLEGLITNFIRTSGNLINSIQTVRSSRLKNILNNINKIDATGITVEELSGLIAEVELDLKFLQSIPTIETFQKNLEEVSSLFSAVQSQGSSYRNFLRNSVAPTLARIAKPVADLGLDQDREEVAAALPSSDKMIAILKQLAAESILERKAPGITRETLDSNITENKAALLAVMDKRPSANDSLESFEEYSLQLARDINTLKTSVDSIDEAAIASDIALANARQAALEVENAELSAKKTQLTKATSGFFKVVFRRVFDNKNFTKDKVELGKATKSILDNDLAKSNTAKEISALLETAKKAKDDSTSLKELKEKQTKFNKKFVKLNQNLALRSELDMLTPALTAEVEEQNTEESALKATLAEAEACLDILSCKPEVQKLIQLRQDIGFKEELLKASIKEVLFTYLEESKSVADGTKPMPVGLTRSFVKLGIAFSDTAGIISPAIKVGLRLIDLPLRTWDKTTHEKRAKIVENLGPELLVAMVDNIADKIAKQFAGNGLADSCLNEIGERTIASMAMHIAMSVIDAAGSGREDKGLTIEKIHAENIGNMLENGKIKPGSMIDRLTDNLISEGLKRSAIESKPVKLAEKLIGKRTTTEVNSAGDNLTGMGAKQGVGIRYTNDRGEEITLVPEGKTLKYGTRLPTKGEEVVLARAEILPGYEVYVSPQEKYEEALNSLSKMAVSLTEDEKESFKDVVNGIVAIHADKIRLLKSHTDESIKELRALIVDKAPQHSEILLSNIDKAKELAEIHNKVLKVDTKKRKKIFGYRIDSIEALAFGIVSALGNAPLQAKIGNEDPLTGIPIATSTTTEKITVTDIVKKRWPTPQKHLLLATRILLQAEYDNPDLNFINRENVTDAAQLFRFVRSAIEAHAKSIDSRNSLATELLTNSGFFNLDSEVNKLKIQEFAASLVVPLAMEHKKYLEQNPENPYPGYVLSDSTAPKEMLLGKLDNLYYEVYGNSEEGKSDKMSNLAGIIKRYQSAKESFEISLNHGDERLKEFLQPLEDLYKANNENDDYYFKAREAFYQTTDAYTIFSGNRDGIDRGPTAIGSTIRNAKGAIETLTNRAKLFGSKVAEDHFKIEVSQDSSMKGVTSIFTTLGFGESDLDDKLLIKAQDYKNVIDRIINEDPEFLKLSELRRIALEEDRSGDRITIDGKFNGRVRQITGELLSKKKLTEFFNNGFIGNVTKSEVVIPSRAITTLKDHFINLARIHVVQEHGHDPEKGFARIQRDETYVEAKDLISNSFSSLASSLAASKLLNPTADNMAKIVKIISGVAAAKDKTVFVSNELRKVILSGPQLPEVAAKLLETASLLSFTSPVGFASPARVFSLLSQSYSKIKGDEALGVVSNSASSADKSIDVDLVIKEKMMGMLNSDQTVDPNKAGELREFCKATFGSLAGATGSDEREEFNKQVAEIAIEAKSEYYNLLDEDTKDEIIHAKLDPLQSSMDGVVAPDGSDVNQARLSDAVKKCILLASQGMEDGVSAKKIQEDIKSELKPIVKTGSLLGASDAFVKLASSITDVADLVASSAIEITQVSEKLATRAAVDMPFAEEPEELSLDKPKTLREASTAAPAVEPAFSQYPDSLAKLLRAAPLIKGRVTADLEDAITKIQERLAVRVTSGLSTNPLTNDITREIFKEELGAKGIINIGRASEAFGKNENRQNFDKLALAIVAQVTHTIATTVAPVVPAITRDSEVVATPPVHTAPVVATSRVVPSLESAPEYHSLCRLIDAQRILPGVKKEQLEDAVSKCVAITINAMRNKAPAVLSDKDIEELNNDSQGYKRTLEKVIPIGTARLGVSSDERRNMNKLTASIREMANVCVSNSFKFNRIPAPIVERTEADHLKTGTHIPHHHDSGSSFVAELKAERAADISAPRHDGTTRT